MISAEEAGKRSSEIKHKRSAEDYEKWVSKFKEITMRSVSHDIELAAQAGNNYLIYTIPEVLVKFEDFIVKELWEAGYVTDDATSSSNSAISISWHPYEECWSPR